MRVHNNICVKVQEQRPTFNCANRETLKRERIMKFSKLIKARPPYRVSIRAQLTALVSIVAILSLVILAIITGVYFTSNYKNLRSDRLYIAAQLKSSQLDQTINYLYYQCYWVASRDTLQTSLANYVAGNKSAENWYDTESVIEKFLSSSNIFSVARVYDASFNPVVNATNNATGDYIPDDVLAKLFPLSTDIALPSSLETTGIVTDPVKNGTAVNSTYLMSMSLPVFANPSIILSDSRVYGYITIVMSAQSLMSVSNDTTALEKSNLAIVSAVYRNSTRVNGYRFVFPPMGAPQEITNVTFTLYNGSFLSGALRQGKGGSLKSSSFFNSRKVAIGYSPCTSSFVNWVAVVSQAESVFLSPSTKLTRIIAGTVVGIGVFVMLVTFPLAHWAVQPIVRLQKATELITEGRGLKPTTPRSVSRNSSIHRARNSIQSSIMQFGGFNEKNTSGIDHGSNHSLNYTIEGTPHPDTQSSTLDSNDRLSNKSRHLTTSANLIQARVQRGKSIFLDELSDLTETFNAMTDALDQHYALLEDRVRARTKQLEAAKIEAEKANEAKTVFIANISHELRTPLNGILGMTAISMEEEDMSKIRNSLKLIFRSGELLLHILTELLTFSKNVLQRTKLEKRNFCITDVALQIKSIFGKVAKDQRVRLSIILSPNIIRTMVLYGDSNRIIQIVMNLVSNALKFTPVDGKVDVRMKVLGEYDALISERFNYKKVIVKRGTEISDETHGNEVLDASPASSKKTSTSNSTATSVDEEGNSSTENENDYNNTQDNVSIVSSSTSSYDDAIFNSQFKKTPDLYEDGSGELGNEVKNPKTWVICIEVEDTGPGIDDSLQESVFEPFVQGDQTLSRQYGGTGLGLSICRQLATMMNGTMEIKSKVGVGSRFTFKVPLSQTREIDFGNMEHAFEDEFNAASRKNRKVKFKMAKSINSRKSRSSIITYGTTNTVPDYKVSLEGNEEKSLGSHGAHNDTNGNNVNDSVSLDRPFLQSTGTATSSRSVPRMSTIETADSTTQELRILVAEDNHVNQEVIKRMLNLEGIKNIDLACDGQDAFEKVKALQEKNDHYHMIFMDVQMPKVDGLLSTKMIRSDLNYNFPIVALTAFADDSNIKECLEAGMNGFLSKPIKRIKLKTIIKEYCPDWELLSDKKALKKAEEAKLKAEQSTKDRLSSANANPSTTDDTNQTSSLNTPHEEIMKTNTSTDSN